MSAEQAARKNIDNLLRKAGWHVCDLAAADLHAARGVAIREFPLATGFGKADYLLYLDGQAAGVIEAKKEGATLTGVEIQSGRYAKGLSERDRELLLGLGWDAPTNLPDEFGHRPDGSPNYYLDLANPVPLDEFAILAVNTLASVYGAEHPNALEYSTGSERNTSIRFPNLGIRRTPEAR